MQICLPCIRENECFVKRKRNDKKQVKIKKTRLTRKTRLVMMQMKGYKSNQFLNPQIKN